MNRPVLVIMAAGMGSRYGGLKQIDPIDEYGNIIMDFSIYDAKMAGFEKVIFIIKKENEQIFRETIGDRISRVMETAYVFQDVNNIPEEFEVPENRVKPWGTGHAILSCIDELDGPFVVINADDYYGRSAFAMIYDYLCHHEDDQKYRYAMVGYRVENTLTENGFVSRGVCKTDDEGYLQEIVERLHIEKRDGRIVFTENQKDWEEIPQGTTVSMNMWGFGVSVLPELKSRFTEFMKNKVSQNPLKSEFYIPSVVDELIKENKASVNVLRSPDKWYGVTYPEDKASVVAAIKELKNNGLYPEKLW